jgi:transcriptional regulator with XRE-family HTH domain
MGETRMATKPELTMGLMSATARKAKSWRLQQLGEAVGTVREGGKAVSPQFINDVEHDRRKPSAELLPAFATVLQLHIDVLHCATGEGLPFVNASLPAHPETGPEIVHLFRRSKEKKFSDWEKLLALIEEGGGENATGRRPRTDHDTIQREWRADDCAQPSQSQDRKKH